MDEPMRIIKSVRYSRTVVLVRSSYIYFYLRKESHLCTRSERRDCWLDAIQDSDNAMFHYEKVVVMRLNWFVFSGVNCWTV